MPIRHGGRFAKNAAIWSRRSCLRSTALATLIDPCTWNTFFARSMPTVVIFMVDAPFRFKWLHQHFHFGTSMPFTGGGVHPIASEDRVIGLVAIFRGVFKGLAARSIRGYL